MAAFFGKKKTGLICGMLLSLSLLCGCHGAREKHEFAVPETFDSAQKIGAVRAKLSRQIIKLQVGLHETMVTLYQRMQFQGQRTLSIR